MGSRLHSEVSVQGHSRIGIVWLYLLPESRVESKRDHSRFRDEKKHLSDVLRSPDSANNGQESTFFSRS